MSLFPRYPGSSRDPETHLRARANRLLDRARAGMNISEERITWALIITGDLNVHWK